MVRLACALCMRVARRRAGCRPQELLTSNGFRMVASDLLRSDSSPVRTNLVGVMAEIVFIAALFTLPDFVRRSNGHSPSGRALRCAFERLSLRRLSTSQAQDQ
jgi:hypothetical protein